MIRLHLCDDTGLARAQQTVTAHHYLHKPVDDRCSPLAYEIHLDAEQGYRIGVLIFGRPESTRCYDGKLTYGSIKDVADGRAQFDRWEVLNLARVWLHPRAQKGGDLFERGYIPLFVDRKGVPRSRLASDVVGLALGRVGYDYLLAKPPCYPDEPYEIKTVLSYCDTKLHKGTIYSASGFELARTNDRGIETWFTTVVAPLSSYQRAMIEKRAGQSYRSRRYRAQRAVLEQQEVFI